MPERTRESKVLSYARRLATLKVERESIEGKEKEIREKLEILMEDDEKVPFTLGDQDWEIAKAPEEKTILKPVEDLAVLMTQSDFISCASITLSKIKQRFGKDISGFVEKYDTEFKLKLRRK